VWKLKIWSSPKDLYILCFYPFLLQKCSFLIHLTFSILKMSEEEEYTDEEVEEYEEDEVEAAVADGADAKVVEPQDAAEGAGPTDAP
jgi:hypothetical protein